MKQKQKNINYRQNLEGKVGALIKDLKDAIQIDAKMIKMREKVEKLQQQSTTESDPYKKKAISEQIEQFSFALDGYEAKRTHEKLKEVDEYLNIIGDIVENIVVIFKITKPLEAKEENEKMIHKNLKHLNRFEEHLLICKCKLQNEQLSAKLARIIQRVFQKKHDQIRMLEYPVQFVCRITTPVPDEQKQKDLNLTPTAGEELEQQLQQIKIEDNPPDVQLTEAEKCQICYDRKKKYVAIPCGHFIYCSKCKDLVMKDMLCLLCRQTVYQMTQVFE